MPPELPADLDAGAAQDFAPDATRVVRVGTTDILVARLGDTDRFAAIDNACPHAGAPLDWSPLRHEDGDVRVICPAHGWCVSVCDGTIVGTSHRTRSYHVVVRNGRVHIATTPTP